MTSSTEMYRFETANLVVRAVIEDDGADLDVSDSVMARKVRAKLNSGEWFAFTTTVTIECAGVVVGQAITDGSICTGGDPAAEFFAPIRRREWRVLRCLTQDAIDEARSKLSKIQKLRIARSIRRAPNV